MSNSKRIYNDTTIRWERRLDLALKSINDRSALNRNSLADSSYIGKLASESYSGHVFPRGLALHDTLLTCIEKISSELGDEIGLTRACTYLQLISEGLSCKEIARQLGLSREHTSRVYRRKALELLIEEFKSTISNKG